MRVFIIFDNDSPEEAYIDGGKAKRRAAALQREAIKSAARRAPLGVCTNYWHIHEVPLVDREELIPRVKGLVNDGCELAPGGSTCRERWPDKEHWCACCTLAGLLEEP